MPSTSQPGFLRRAASALRIPVPVGNAKPTAAVNQTVSPFGQTSHATRAGGFGAALTDIRSHGVVQHPNILHGPRAGASPFIESNASGNAYAGRARHHPAFSSTRGLNGGTRK